MAEDLMRYDLLAQDALRSVVRLALLHVRENGLPGDHHFFIAVSLDHPGVTVSERLRKKYDDEMTIVLQHQFWNLEVFDKFFEVELSFDNTPEKLIVPYSAVKGFFDPSVQFGLQFEVAGDAADAEKTETAAPETDEPATEDEQDTPELDLSELPETAHSEASNDDSTVVSLDSFRNKK